MTQRHGSVDTLHIVLGDQLDLRTPALRNLDAACDAILMMEVAEEATHVPSHVQRTVLFLSAMRHFVRDLRRRGLTVRYVELDDPNNSHRFADEIKRACRATRPRRLQVLRPGEWRVLHQIEEAASSDGVPLAVAEDPHFYLTPDEFGAWARGRKLLLLEHFYRMMRRRFGILVDEAGKPRGGTWNFDKENRAAYRGEVPIPAAPRFRTDLTTRDVMRMVTARFPDAPGTMDGFNWPVTRRQALRALRAFIDTRLPHFGRYQDAMVQGEPWMYHALLSPALNLKLLDPREVVAAALAALEEGHAPINAVEGFVRQLIGWREFIRGVYWHEGPDYGERNALNHRGALPDFYWTGNTDMRCLRECISQVVSRCFGHHIQRLMVTGNFALLAGIEPRTVSNWYLGMYVDGVDWVTLPNALGMALHADGGIVGTKPYAAGGRYIDRMSDYCTDCPYDPKQRTGTRACPFTTLYWAFLDRHRSRLASNRRMTFAMKNLQRIPGQEMKSIRERAEQVMLTLGVT